MEKKVLLVNAMKTVVERDRKILDRAGVRILSASGAAEAVEVHRREKLDLILLDMATEGEMLCRTIRADAELRHVSIIAVCSSPAEKAAAEKCGANAVVMRPYRSESLVDKVGEFLAVQTRRGYRVLISAEVDAAAGRDRFFCTSRNISITGLLIETERVLAMGQELSCSFFLGTQRVAAVGEVVRVVPVGSETQYGLRFVTVEPAAKALIERFVSDN